MATITSELIGEGLLESPESKVHSLEPEEIVEVQCHVQEFLDQLWDKLTSEEEIIRILNFVLRQYSETVAELVDVRNTSLANASRLDSLRTEFDKFILFTEDLAKAHEEEKATLQAKIDSLKIPRNRTYPRRSRPTFSSLGEAPQSSRLTDSKEEGNTGTLVLNNFAGSKRRSDERSSVTVDSDNVQPLSKKQRGGGDWSEQRGSDSALTRSKGISYLTVRGNQRSAERHHTEHEMDAQKLSKFKSKNVTKNMSGNQRQITWMMDWNEYAHRIDPTVDDCWKEMTLAISNSQGLQNLLTASDSLEREGEELRKAVSWDAKVALLLNKAIPANLNQTLKQEARRLEYISAASYQQQILKFNKLLGDLSAKEFSDEEMISCVENALGRGAEASHRQILSDWTAWKCDPDHAGQQTFEMAMRRITSYEIAFQENERRFQISKTQQNQNQRTQLSQKEYQKQQQVRFGDLCPFTNCKHREKTKEAMDNHKKHCRFRKPKQNATNANLTTVTVMLGSIEPEDYMPILNVFLRPNQSEEKGVEAKAFIDPGSGFTLISKNFQQSLSSDYPDWQPVKGSQYLVKGVDATGKGVVCKETITIFLRLGSAGDREVEITALIVPGLPERLVLGRDVQRETELQLIFGPNKADNKIVSEPFGVDQQMLTTLELEGKSREEMDTAAMEIVAESNLTRVQAYRTFTSCTTAEMEEIFEKGPQI